MTLPKVSKSMADDVLHSGGMPVDEDHQVESPEVSIDPPSVPPVRLQPPVDSSIRVSFVQRDRVIERWRISVGLTRPDQRSQLFQQSVRCPSQLDPGRGHRDVQRGVGMHVRKVERDSFSQNLVFPGYV